MPTLVNSCQQRAYLFERDEGPQIIQRFSSSVEPHHQTDSDVAAAANHGAFSDRIESLELRMLEIEHAVKTVPLLQRNQALDHEDAFARIEDRLNALFEFRMAELDVSMKMMQELQSRFHKLESSSIGYPPNLDTDHEDTKHQTQNHTGVDDAGASGTAGFAVVSASPVVAHAVIEGETGAVEQPKDDGQEADAELIEHVDSELDTYALQHSVWDAFFLQWFRTRLGIGSGPLDVVVTVLLFIANVVMQVLLIFLVFTNMSSTEWITDDLLKDLLSWRLTVAQAMSHYQPESNTSLATRVCTGDSARILADGQAGTQNQIAEYLLDNPPFNGPVLLACALIIWILLIGIEVLQILEFTYALSSIKHSSHNVGTWHQDDQFTIDAISSQSRGLMALVIVVPRVFIVGWLCVAGVLYLVHSSSMGELILNCMALGFILDIDELLFNYVPKRTAFKLSVTRPVKLQHHNLWKRDHGLDIGRMFSYSVLILITPAMVTIWFHSVQPLVDDLYKADAILCGGKANMVFTGDKSNAVTSYAITAPQKVTFHPEYQSIAVMQAIELRNVPELAEFLKDWPRPDIVYANRTSLYRLDTLHRHSQKEAVSEQLCLDLDYEEPGRASLKALTGMDSCNETSGYDMHGRCTEPMVRRYCPVTCFCDAVSWWYDRRGCPPMCETKHRIDLQAFLHEHASHHDGCKDGNGEGLASMAPVGGNLSEFAKALELDLIDDGRMEESGHLVGRWQNSLDMHSLNQCVWLGDASIDREDILLDWACESMIFLSSLFDLGLCDVDYTRFRKGVGNIAAYCPDSCRVCPLKDYSPQRPTTIMHSLYKNNSNVIMFHPRLARFLACGYEWLFCGERRNGTTIGANNYIGSFAPDKIYRFYAGPDKKYSFTVRSYPSKTAMKLKIYDSQLQFAGANLLGEDYQIFTFLPLTYTHTFAQAGKYHLVIETVDPLQTTDFQVSMSSDEAPCRGTMPLQIRCGENLSVIVGRQDEFDLFGSLSRSRWPEKIFKFQADVGVEYTFDSCGSSRNNFLYLHDEFLRDPPLVEVNANCTKASRRNFSHVFSAPGDYYLVVELRKFGSIRSEEDIHLAMQCNRRSIP